MQTVDLDGFLFLHGERIDVQESNGIVSCTGFGKVDFRQSPVTLSVRCQSTFAMSGARAGLDRPPFGPNVQGCAVQWDRRQAQSDSGPGARRTITFHDAAAPTVFLRIATPLSRFGVGYWLRLDIKKTSSGWRFEIRKGGTGCLLASPREVGDEGVASTEWDVRDFQSLFRGVMLGTSMTLEEFRAAWADVVTPLASEKWYSRVRGQPDPLFEGAAPLWGRLDRTSSQVYLLAPEPAPILGDMQSEQQYWLVPRFVAESVHGDLNLSTLGLDFDNPSPVRVLSPNRLSLAAFEEDIALTPGERVHWLECRDVPGGNGDEGQLTVATFWQVLARHYALGLASVRARSALTFFPHRLSASGADRWQFRVRMSTAVGMAEVGAVATWLGKIVAWQPTGSAANLTVDFAGATDRQGAPVTRMVAVQPREAVDGLGRVSESLWQWVELKQYRDAPLFSLTGRGVDSAEAQELVIGGVRVMLGALNKFRIDVEPRSSALAGRFGQSPLTVFCQYDFAGGMPGAASQDPEYGFETLGGWQARERPLSIDLSDSTTGSTTVSITESTSERQSRLLRITVKASQQTAFATDTIVIDRAPLTIARVVSRGDSVERGGLLAEYTDDAELPAEWVYPNRTGAVQLVLPPQAIGEEMIKGNEVLPGSAEKSGLPVPLEGELFDYRLSPVTTLDIDLSDIDTARVIAPWSTRRYFGQRLGVSGVRLTRAQFELLYGLTTTVEDKGLRIADLDAFVGRVPVSDDLVGLLRQARLREIAGALGSDLSPEERHARAHATWVGELFSRPSMLSVFRELADRSVLTIQDGLNFHFRETRQTAHPIDIDRYAAAPAHTRRIPLRGGVDYPFESRNVYDSVIRSGDSRSGYVSGLVFGPFGGRGSQQAVFDNGRTLIITQTTDGRLDSYTLIRRGRIGMLWNHARHVIVYVRSTRTAPRYQEQGGGTDRRPAEQPSGFEGLAALRKVAEYIEITQPRRTYPDTRTDRPIAGPMLASAFETTMIPVKAEWGGDVPGGMVMALRGPLQPSEERFYPFPKIFLQFARPEAKGGGAVSQRISDPSVLQFFTSTRAEDKGETDQWPAWPDIDYPLQGRPAPPPLATRPRLGNPRQPDAASHDFGQRRFTVPLDPVEEAVNLMHGRPVPGVEAKLSNVSLARGMPESAPQVPSRLAEVGAAFGHAQAQIEDGVEELLCHVRALAASSPGMAPSAVPGFQAKAQGIVAGLQQSAAFASEKLQRQDVNLGVDWPTRQTRLLNDFRRGLETELRAVLGAQLRNAIPAPDASDPVPSVKRRLNDALDQVCAQARRRVEMIPSLHEQILRAAEHLITQAEAKTGEFTADKRRAFRTAIDHAEHEWRTGDDLESLSPLVAASEAVIEAVQLFVAESSKWLDEALRRGMGAKPAPDSESPQQVFAQCLEQWVDTWIEWQAEVWSILEDADADMFARLRAMVDRFDVPEGLFDLARAWLAELAASTDFGDIRESGHEAVEAACRAAHDVVESFPDDGAMGDLVGKAKAMADTVLRDWESGLKETANALDKRFTALRGAEPWKSLEDSTAAVDEFRERVASKVAALAENLIAAPDLKTLAEQLTGVAADVAGGLAGVGNRIEQSLGQVFQDASSLSQTLQAGGLELTRALATGPVTDTLACTRDRLGYYYDAAKQALDLTRASALFNQLGPKTLNALSAAVPFDRLRDRLLPQLRSLDIKSLFPDFGGLKLENLLKDLRIPEDPLAEYDWIKTTHGFDRDRLTAWADVQIDKSFDDNPDLFTLPPVALKVMKPVFRARSRLEVGRDGARSQKTQALLVADWTLTLQGQEVLRIERGGLYYDNQGGFDFRFRPEDIRLAPALKFITDALQSLFPSDSGVRIVPLGGGISATLDLPLPDIGTGAFTLTGISLHTHFDILVVPTFEVRTGVWLSKPERPFGLAILFLGGGGWFGVDVSYRPPSWWRTRVSIGISAGAFLAVNLGVASGSVGILFTLGLDFYQEPDAAGGGMTVTVGLVMWGELSIMGIASAYLRVTLSVTYGRGEMIGRGQITVSIRISWFFTLRVSSPITMPFKRSGKGTERNAVAAQPAARAVTSPPVPPAVVKRAVERHLDTLDW